MADENARDESADPDRTQAVGGEPTRPVPEQPPVNPWSSPAAGEPAAAVQQPEQPQQPPYPPPYPPQHGHPQYGHPQYGHPQHGQPQYGHPQPLYGPGQYAPGYAVPATSGRATAVLITGIASLVLLFSCIGFIPAIVALVLAPGAEHEINASQGRLTGLGQVRAGRICSWITIAVTVLVLVVAGVVIAISMATSSNDSGFGY